ncbi:unnamed protein product [Closterium sp. Yama58-4]|nr:unnamed protein product [Closterium sp. Yama58-4]
MTDGPDTRTTNPSAIPALAPYGGSVAPSTDGSGEACGGGSVGASVQTVTFRFPALTGRKRRQRVGGAFFAAGDAERELLAKQLSLLVTAEEVEAIMRQVRGESDDAGESLASEIDGAGAASEEGRGEGDAMAVSTETKDIDSGNASAIPSSSEAADLLYGTVAHNADALWPWTRITRPCTAPCVPRVARRFPSNRLLNIHVAEAHDSFFQAKVARGAAMYECLVETCTHRFPSDAVRHQHLVDRHHYPPSFHFHSLSHSHPSQRRRRQMAQHTGEGGGREGGMGDDVNKGDADVSGQKGACGNASGNDVADGVGGTADTVGTAGVAGTVNASDAVHAVPGGDGTPMCGATGNLPGPLEPAGSSSVPPDSGGMDVDKLAAALPHAFHHPTATASRFDISDRRSTSSSATSGDVLLTDASRINKEHSRSWNEERDTLVAAASETAMAAAKQPRRQRAAGRCLSPARLSKWRDFIGSLRPSIVVAKDGSGNYRTISVIPGLLEVMAVAPKGAVIYVRAGVYEEQVRVRQDRVVLLGEGHLRTVIRAGRNQAEGTSLMDTATLSIYGSNFVGMGLGVENTAGPQGKQAVAARSDGDKTAFYHCRFSGYQDTLFAQEGRHYYSHCLIEGTTDFIFGEAAAVFYRCTLAARPSPEPVYIAASGRASATDSTGFVFIRSDVTSSEPGTQANQQGRVYLGRPWGMYARTVFIESRMSGVVNVEGWAAWHGRPSSRFPFFAEYGSHGPGAAEGSRAAWVQPKVLGKDEVKKFWPGRFIRLHTWKNQTRIPC